MVNKSDNVESVGHDFGVGKVFANDAAIRLREVHYHDSNTLSALEFPQETIQ